MQEVELDGVVDGGHACGVDGDEEEVPPRSTSFSVTKAYLLLYFFRFLSSVGIWDQMTAAETALIHAL